MGKEECLGSPATRSREATTTLSGKEGQWGKEECLGSPATRSREAATTLSGKEDQWGKPRRNPNEWCAKIFEKTKNCFCRRFLPFLKSERNS